MTLMTVVASLGTASAQTTSLADTIGIIERAITTVSAEAGGVAVVVVPRKDSALTSRVAAQLGLPHKNAAEFLICDRQGGGTCRFEHPMLLVSVDGMTIVGDSANITVYTSQPEGASHVVAEHQYVFVLRRRDDRWRVTIVLSGSRVKYQEVLMKRSLPGPFGNRPTAQSASVV
jgi:hypothetical protein